MRPPVQIVSDFDSILKGLRPFITRLQGQAKQMELLSKVYPKL